MSQVIITLYEDYKTAEAAAKQLVRDKKLNAQDVSLLTYEGDTSAEAGRDSGDNTFLAQKLGSRRDLGAVHDTLVSLGVNDSDAGDFVEGLRRGNTLLVVQADEAAGADIHQILVSRLPGDISTSPPEPIRFWVLGRLPGDISTSPPEPTVRGRLPDDEA